VRGAYARATVALRLPFHGGFAAMAPVVRDAPLIARKSALARDDARRALGLTPADGRPVVLAYGYGPALPYERLAAERRFVLAITDHELPSPPPALQNGAPDFRRFVMADLAARGLRYKDIVAAADVIVSKPGYGIVTECVASGAALLYSSRGRFAEHDVFLAEMPRAIRCRFIAQEDLLAGRWTTAIDALLRQPPPPESLPIDGADVAAAEVLRLGARG
jgi:L-arabinokinase